LKILGIHDGHNSSVTLLIDGEIIYAIQEERLVYQKNYFGFPYKSIEAALKFSKLKIKDIDYIAFASNHTAKPEFVIKTYKKQITLDGKLRHIFYKTPLYILYKNYRKKRRLAYLKNYDFPQEKVAFIEHHLCHASAVYYGLVKLKNEKILILTADGSGDGLCATVNIGENGDIKRIASTEKGHSLGNIYSRVTYMLGFVPWEHEYKLMGMAPYVYPEGQTLGYNVFKNYIDVCEDKKLKFKRKIDEPTTLIYNRLRKDTELKRFDTICAGLQRYTEDVLCRWVRNCIQETGIRNVALSGGIFMNVKVNKKIMELEEIEKLLIMPSCGDVSNSIGAAYRLFYEKCNKKVYPNILKNLYLGDGIDDNNSENILKDFIKNGIKIKYEYCRNIEKRIAQLLAKKNIVARCAGRMEFGARALGNRSILADPSDLKVVREINLMVKKRDFWMPFAPVILEERANDYLINPKNIDAPFMILSFNTTKKAGNDCIAAVHQADLTARPQIIRKNDNKEYYSILKEFEKITGRGVLLNTSFNLHGFPIVCGAEEAINVFLNSGLKYLALGNYLITKLINS